MPAFKLIGLAASKKPPNHPDSTLPTRPRHLLESSPRPRSLCHVPCAGDTHLDPTRLGDFIRGAHEGRGVEYSPSTATEIAKRLRHTWEIPRGLREFYRMFRISGLHAEEWSGEGRGAEVCMHFCGWELYGDVSED